MGHTPTPSEATEEGNEADPAAAAVALDDGVPAADEDCCDGCCRRGGSGAGAAKVVIEGEEVAPFPSVACEATAAAAAALHRCSSAGVLFFEFSVPPLDGSDGERAGADEADANSSGVGTMDAAAVVEEADAPPPAVALPPPSVEGAATDGHCGLQPPLLVALLAEASPQIAAVAALGIGDEEESGADDVEEEAPPIVADATAAAEGPIAASTDAAAAEAACVGAGAAAGPIPLGVHRVEAIIAPLSAPRDVSAALPRAAAAVEQCSCSNRVIGAGLHTDLRVYGMAAGTATDCCRLPSRVGRPPTPPPWPKGPTCAVGWRRGLMEALLRPMPLFLRRRPFPPADAARPAPLRWWPRAVEAVASLVSCGC